MKKLLLLLAFCGWAHAETLAYIVNKAGGAIVFTDIKNGCNSYPGAAYATSEGSNSTLWGCWFSDDFMMHVIWSDGSRTSYQINNLTVNQEKLTRWRERYDKQKYD